MTQMVIKLYFSNNENEKYFNVAGGHEQLAEDNCSGQVTTDD